MPKNQKKPRLASSFRNFSHLLFIAYLMYDLYCFNITERFI
ncbi:hypothetical protein [Flavobacterium sp.]|nr:hypothetical protein [Flavobacterium sp.]